MRLFTDGHIVNGSSAPPWTTLVWLTTLGVSMSVLLAAPITTDGGGVVDPTLWWQWASGAPSGEVLISAIRQLALFATGYLFAVSTLVLVIGVVNRSAAFAVSRILPAFARRALGPLLGMSVLVSSVGTGTAGATEGATAGDGTSLGSVATATLSHEPGRTATISWIGVTADTTVGLVEPAHQWETDVARVGHSQGFPVGSAPGADWIVEPGDHFWSIAEHTQPPGVGLEQHWRKLIELNRDRLPDPSNPDLILPGMSLRVR